MGQQARMFALLVETLSRTSLYSFMQDLSTVGNGYRREHGCRTIRQPYARRWGGAKGQARYGATGLLNCD
jgi:hypothetical protein